MKRFLVLMLAGLLVFTGCGGQKLSEDNPELEHETLEVAEYGEQEGSGLSEKNLEIGHEALEMIDKCLDGEIDSEELKDQMYAIGKKW